MSERGAKKKAPAKRRGVKKADKKDPEVSEEVPAPTVKMGPVPSPNVLSRHEGAMHERRGKGFSPGELATVGLTRVRALSLRVPVDIRRRSVLQGNEAALKAWYKAPAKKREAPKEEKPKAEKKKPAKKTAKKKTKKE